MNSARPISPKHLRRICKHNKWHALNKFIEGLGSIDGATNALHPHKPIELQLIEEGLLLACEHGSLEVVEQILTHPNLPGQYLIHYLQDSPLLWASGNGHLHLVKYLLTSPKLPNKADIHAQEDGALIWASGAGHLEVVSFLLSSEELTSHCDLRAQNHEALLVACQQGMWAVASYLLNLYEKINCPSLQQIYEKAFFLLIQTGEIRGFNEQRWQLVQHFIFNTKMAPTAEVLQYSQQHHPNIMRLLQLKSLADRLQESLPMSQTINEKTKI